MSTKFFNNTLPNTLFDKIKGIASEMASFDRFLAVVGYFRSSGYFKLRKELGDVSEIRILIGINADNIFRKHNLGWELLEAPEKAKELYNEQFKQDIIDANYSKEVEDGIIQLCQDLADGRLQLRLHPTKNLHAKFYLCLPQNHTVNSDGWVIMGSSNISDSGLGTTSAPQYELNVAMKDFDDVHYCHEEFETLWNESIPLTLNEVEKYKSETYLGQQPTPYELYIKVLIEVFGDQVEDDFTLQLPDSVKELKYQKDAVTQGYQMLMQHNGLFLSDVVGLGKTMIATMIAKRFIEANGKNTKILVVYPPALEDNWKSTFKLFGISRKAQFITNGSLSKVLEGRDQYHDKEEFDLIIVDEAHQFRSDTAGRYDELQKICKSPCINMGLLKSVRKKVMLLSATPLNNRPEDLLNQLLLFQDAQRATIDGITNLKQFFIPLIAKYKKLMRERDTRDVTNDVDSIYASIRDKVIDKVTIRRTRTNITNDPDYKKDLEAQGIIFPNIFPPKELTYNLSESLSNSFYSTLTALTDESVPKHITYARYRAVEFLKPEFQERYKNATQIGQSLAGIYRVHMVKRLESSFYAFRKSLNTLLRITSDMIKMFEEDKVIIAPELNIKDLQFKGLSLDEILDYIREKGYSTEDVLYHADDFDPKFIEMLRKDQEVLQHLNNEWAEIKDDPKLDLFLTKLPELTSKEINPTGKLVIFSESVDTVNYLAEKLGETGRTDILKIAASNRRRLFDTVKANFDANVPASEQKDDYSIIITSDVLAEGVNLHRANVIVNYDSPWNASRLMQRIGRVNRIGSVAENIYNYMFYPSQQGDKEIKLYKNALIKLQGFHSALGEDAQIYSREEIVQEFQLFDSNIKDTVDQKIALLRELRNLYNNNREWYHHIKALPLKSRVIRETGKHTGTTVAYVSSNLKSEFYRITEQRPPQVMDFLTAIKYLKAKPEEQAVKNPREELHYAHVNRAVNEFKSVIQVQTDTDSVTNVNLDKTAQAADKFLRTICQIINDDNTLKRDCGMLRNYVKEGLYNQLPRTLKTISQKYKNDRSEIQKNAEAIAKQITELVEAYHNASSSNSNIEISNPSIIISETFI